MSTFPRRVNSKLLQPTSLSATETTQETVVGHFLAPRPLSEAPQGAGLDFDAGINSSNAWTKFFSEDGLNLTKQEDETSSDPLSEVTGRLAIVLYDFSGQSDLGELSVETDEELEILQERVPSDNGADDSSEGWSLARKRTPVSEDPNAAEIAENDDNESTQALSLGLVPRTYYVFSDEVNSSLNRDSSENEMSTGGTPTPRASRITDHGITLSNNESTPAPPPSLSPQTTGEWFRAQLRRGSQLLGLAGGSLFSGIGLNKFSYFVSSGAEDFILNGAEVKDAIQLQKEQTEPANDGLPNDTSSRISTYFSHIRNPTEEAQEDYDNPGSYVIDVGPTWRAKVPLFSVRVHSPEKRQTLQSEKSTEPYIVYCVSSTFSDQTDSTPIGTYTQHSVSVYRRFSHFVRLHAALAARLPGVALPPLPEKSYAGRFNSDFVEARRNELDRYVRRLTTHPVVRYTDELTFFLGCEDELEFQRNLSHKLRCFSPFSRQGWEQKRLFFKNVYHPDFQFDIDDAEQAGTRFARHGKAVSQGVQQLRSNFGQVRESRQGMANSERLLSYSLLSLISSTPFQNTVSGQLSESESEHEEDDALRPPNGKSNAVKPNGSVRVNRHGLINNEGAWCWRDDCSECLRVTKCMQKTAETMQGVADLFDDHANRTMYATEDRLKDIAHPEQLHAPVLDIHEATINMYKPIITRHQNLKHKILEANETNEDRTQLSSEEDVASRCETVLNTTMAELDVYHNQKVRDVEDLMKSHLDGEIAFYEKILSRLRTTRDLFDTSMDELALTMPGPCSPSVYEKALRESPIEKLIQPRPLNHPCPHVLDKSRTISSALQGGVGLLVAGVSGMTVSDNHDRPVDGSRNGTFSRLW